MTFINNLPLDGLTNLRITIVYGKRSSTNWLQFLSPERVKQHKIIKNYIKILACFRAKNFNIKRQQICVRWYYSTVKIHLTWANDDKHLVHFTPFQMSFLLAQALI